MIQKLALTLVQISSSIGKTANNNTLERPQNDLTLAKISSNIISSMYEVKLKQELKAVYEEKDSILAIYHI
jgi:hypothetical protein